MTDKSTDGPAGKSESWRKDLNFSRFSPFVSKMLRNAYDTMPWELRDNIVLGNARPDASVVVYINDDEGAKIPSYASYVLAKPISDYIINKLTGGRKVEIDNDL